ncbi:[FeFe] hydrogenase H-cluster radical SAM maturase HydG [Marinilabiliaceae bacterium ANBcel2]|nr:[FeFe] hydrogenase H-cluster radical SAM maturase HydG [Marinilabiliaceae bacterium ANBcel2]
MYNPQQYNIEDIPEKPFVDCDEIESFLLRGKNGSFEQVRSVICKALNRERLSLYETSVLVNVTDKNLREEIKEAAGELKKKIYGNRIVLFAPLYTGNYCINECSYCGFSCKNQRVDRTSLTFDEIKEQVTALESCGHKRVVVSMGEHPCYGSGYIADLLKTIYSVKEGKGAIRRINVNAAPLDVEGFRKVKDAGVGTYQIFQETYNKKRYREVHRSGKKRDYEWRLTAFDRALKAGLDDVGLGVLLGLYDWRYEVLGLIRHVNHLESTYNVGPHTISFPRLKSALGVNFENNEYDVSDEDFVFLVAVLRLAVPYTGMILTAREPAAIRDMVLRYGVSQIDGGSKIGVGGYSSSCSYMGIEKKHGREQFALNDMRSLDEVIHELIKNGYLPSFCTACYRLGRTGEHFMEFSVPGFIKRFCFSNAILTFAEYLEDYASVLVKQKGYNLIDKNLRQYRGKEGEKVITLLNRIRNGERDLFL